MTSLFFGNNIISSLRQMCKPVIRSLSPHFRLCLYMEEGQLFWQRYIIRVSVKLFVKIYFRLYESGAALLCGIWLRTTRYLAQKGCKFFHINALKITVLTRQNVYWPASFWIHFHFTSSVSLCVGYKMKTCAQILDSEFHSRKKDVVTLGRLTRVSGPAGQESWLFPWKHDMKSSTLTMASRAKKACFLHINTPLIRCNNRLIWYPIWTCQKDDYLDNEMRC